VASKGGGGRGPNNPRDGQIQVGNLFKLARRDKHGRGVDATWGQGGTRVAMNCVCELLRDPSHPIQSNQIGSTGRPVSVWPPKVPPTPGWAHGTTTGCGVRLPKQPEIIMASQRPGHGHERASRSQSLAQKTTHSIRDGGSTTSTLARIAIFPQSHVCGDTPALTSPNSTNPVPLLPPSCHSSP
jgi:hypothetical protein